MSLTRQLPAAWGGHSLRSLQPRRNGVCDDHCIPMPELEGRFLLSTSLNVALPKTALPFKPGIFQFSLINNTLGNTTLEEWQFSRQSFVLELYLEWQLPRGYDAVSGPGQTQWQTCFPSTQSSSCSSLFMSYPVSYQHCFFGQMFSVFSRSTCSLYLSHSFSWF